jgi:hypothetical protein
MKNVSKKLLAAIAKVNGKVEKTGYNSFSRYKYITESDVNQAVLPALLEQGLLLTTSIESVVETPAGADSKNRFATVHLVHSIIDTESGEAIILKSAGTAADTLDKSIYKAYTGACKYFMLKTFLISGDDSDPENDAKEAPPAQKQAFGKPAPAQEKKGFMARKTETTVSSASAPAATSAAKKPSFGAKKAPEPVQVEETQQNSEEDAAY